MYTLVDLAFDVLKDASKPLTINQIWRANKDLQKKLTVNTSKPIVTLTKELEFLVNKNYSNFVLVDEKYSLKSNAITSNNSQLNNSRWNKIANEIKDRHLIVSQINTKLSKDFPNNKNNLTIAATNTYVENARRVMSIKAFSFFTLGAITSILSMIILFFVALIAYEMNLQDTFDLINKQHEPGYALTIYLIKNATAGGFITGLVIYLISLSRALLHEGTTSLNRRNAFRFGDMFVFAKGGDVTYKQFVNLFKWNDEFKSEFQSIKPTDSAISPSKSVTELVKNKKVKKKKRGKGIKA